MLETESLPMLLTDLTGCVTNISHEPQESENVTNREKYSLYSPTSNILNNFEPSVRDSIL